MVAKQGPTAEQIATWRSLLVSMHVLELALDRQLTRSDGMPHLYFAMLVTLSEQPGGRCRLTDLAAWLGCTQTRVTHAVTKLASEGWVRREPRAHNRRETDAVLTESGRAAMEAAEPRHAAFVRDVVFSRLTQDQTSSLHAICETLLAGLLELPELDDIPRVISP